MEPLSTVFPIQSALSLSGNSISEESPLSDLPEELILKIFSHLNVRENIQTQKTCKLFLRILRDDVLWNGLFQYAFPLYRKPLGINYLDYFKENYIHHNCHRIVDLNHKQFYSSKNYIYEMDSGDNWIAFPREHQGVIIHCILIKNAPPDVSLASSSLDRTIKIWQKTAVSPFRCTQTLTSHQSVITIFRSLGDYLFSSSQDIPLCIHKKGDEGYEVVATGNLNNRQDTLTAVYLEKSPLDGFKLFCGTDDGNLEIWKYTPRSFLLIQKIKLASSAIKCLHYTPFKSTLIAATEECLVLECEILKNSIHIVSQIKTEHPVSALFFDQYKGFLITGDTSGLVSVLKRSLKNRSWNLEFSKKLSTSDQEITSIRVESAKLIRVTYEGSIKPIILNKVIS